MILNEKQHFFSISKFFLLFDTARKHNFHENANIKKMIRLICTQFCYQQNYADCFTILGSNRNSKMRWELLLAWIIKLNRVCTGLLNQYVRIKFYSFGQYVYIHLVVADNSLRDKCTVREGLCSRRSKRNSLKKKKKIKHWLN